MKTTIPGEIAALQFPDIEQVVLAGSGVLELEGIRVARDIDLATTFENREYLLESDPDYWKKVVHRYRRLTDNSRFQVTSVGSADGRFDIWRQWYDFGRPIGNRIIQLDELIANSRQHKLGFYVLHLSFVRQLKAAAGRENDLVDVEMIDHFRRDSQIDN